MANRDTIYRELIQLDWEVKDQDEFFDKMADKLLELGILGDMLDSNQLSVFDL